jgi:hypothetical protein
MNMPPPDWVYYHALYHLVTHYAGFYATFGLLISLVFLLSVTQKIDKLGAVCCYVATGATVVGSWFFLERMTIYANVVARMLPVRYTQELSSMYIGTKTNVFAGLVTLGLGIGVCWLATQRSSIKRRAAHFRPDGKSK